MLIFEFNGKDKFNNAIKGTVEAESFDSAYRLLEAEGYSFITLTIIEEPVQQNFYFSAKDSSERTICGEINANNLDEAYAALYNEGYCEILLSETPIQNQIFNNAYSLNLPNNRIKTPTKKNTSNHSHGAWIILGLLTNGWIISGLLIHFALELNRAASKFDKKYTYLAVPIFDLLFDASISTVFYVNRTQKTNTTLDMIDYPIWLIVLLTIYGLINAFWFHSFCDRISNELKRRKIKFYYSPLLYWSMVFIVSIINFIIAPYFWNSIYNLTDVWIPLLCLSLILTFTKWAFYYITITAMNLINEDYNSGRNNL